MARASGSVVVAYTTYGFADFGEASVFSRAAKTEECIPAIVSIAPTSPHPRRSLEFHAPTATSSSTLVMRPALRSRAGPPQRFAGIRHDEEWEEEEGAADFQQHAAYDRLVSAQDQTYASFASICALGIYRHLGLEGTDWRLCTSPAPRALGSELEPPACRKRSHIPIAIS